MPRRYRPVTREDVADDNPTVIARQLRMLQQEVRDGFEMLANRIMTRLDAHQARIDAHEARIDRIEDHVTELRRSAPRKATR